MKTYKKIFPPQYFTEELKLSDLKKHAGISDFTKRWKNDRATGDKSQVKGRASTSIKIKSMKVNRRQDYVSFTFISIPTYLKKVQAVNFPDLSQKRKTTQYEQEIRINQFFALARTKPGYVEKELTPAEIKEILNVADIQVACNCMSFQYQGMNAILTMFNASIYPELRMPKRWDKYHHDDNFLCKHLSILITSGLNIYINNMTLMINKFIQGSK